LHNAPFVVWTRRGSRAPAATRPLGGTERSR
jgi:hypothetical protein